MQIFLVHGEFAVQQQLAEAIRAKYDFAVDIPEYLEEIQLKTGAEIEAIIKHEVPEPQIDLNTTLDDLRAKIERINNIKQKIQKLSFAQKTEIQELLKEADRSIDEVESRL